MDRQDYSIRPISWSTEQLPADFREWAEGDIMLATPIYLPEGMRISFPVKFGGFLSKEDAQVFVIVDIITGNSHTVYSWDWQLEPI